MTNVKDYRRINLLRVIEQYGTKAKVAKLLGYKNGTFLTQVTSQNPNAKLQRTISEENARWFEDKLNLPVGALDMPTPFDLPPKVSSDNLMDLIMLIGKELGDAPIPANKFANIVALSLADPTRVKQYAELVK